MLPLSPLLSRFPELCPFVSFGFEQAQDARAPKPTAGSGSSSFCRVHGRSHASESAEVKQFISHLEQRLIMELNPAEALEANRRLQEDLNRAERKAARLEMEVTLLKKNMGRKTTALQTTREELRQARQQMEQSQALYMQADQERKDAVQRAEELRERVAQLQGENLWLRQQLGDAQNKAAPEPVREMGQPEETSVAAGTQQHDGLERENPHVPEDLDKVKAKVCELSAQLELHSQLSLQLKASIQGLQELVALLPQGLATPGGAQGPAALRGQGCEQPREEQLEPRRRDLDPNVQRSRNLWDQSRSAQPGLSARAGATPAEAAAQSPREPRRRRFRRQAKTLGQSRGWSGSPSGSGTAERGAGSAGDSPRVSPAPLPNADDVQGPPVRATPADLDGLEEELLE
nr:ankyrin repeat domain-containing protein 26-like isoform X1 [Columba livia]